MGPKDHDTLFQIADTQRGYFTSRQAVEAGVRSTNHAYHVRAGNWLRQWRGVYRLTEYPFHEDEHYALWAVWSMSRKGEMLGVFSHETALSMHELSDVNPARIHMTVPRGFRRHSEIPPVLCLHFSSLRPVDREDRGAYKVTSVARTIADLVRTRTVSTGIIAQAVNEGLQSGKLTRERLARLKAMPLVGPRLDRMLEGHDAS
jgi:predicted transcriptional regulator of viral defense system